MQVQKSNHGQTIGGGNLKVRLSEYGIAWVAGFTEGKTYEARVINDSIKVIDDYQHNRTFSNPRTDTHTAFEEVLEQTEEDKFKELLLSE